MRERKSPNKLLPNTKDTEDLLKSLENVEVSTEEVYLEEDYRNDSLAFISAYNLQPGKNLVQKTVIYYLYSKWSKNKLTNEQLSRELGKFFSSDTVKGKTYYLLNQKALDLTKAGFAIVKKHTKDVTKEVSRKRHFEAFLKAHDLSPGDYYIEGYILFRLYDKWTYENKCKKPIGDIRFFQLLRLYFKCKAVKANETFYFGVAEKGILNNVGIRKIQRLRKAKEAHVKRQDKAGVYKEGKKRKKKPDPFSRLRPWSESKD